MLMSVQNENASSAGETVVLERPEAGGVYASLFEKINLKPASHLSDIKTWLDEAAMAEADANERITAGVQVFMDCIRKSSPQAGGAVKDLPIHLYDLDTGNQVKIPSEVMIPETREFEFANLGFIPLSYYKNRDYACFFSANSTQKPVLYDTADATANSRINARLPYIFLLSRIAHYLKLIQRENIGTIKDRRLLELELNTWVRSLVTEMTDPGDELQASHPLRDAKVVVEDIEDNPGFFRVKLYAVPHFQVEGMDVNLSLVSQMPKAKA
ncbi:type VI secretion system contractile sheath large subunit [Citrobacter sp. Igbk 16]|uniref:type VI secretion system contractile sheath large subunit n=1 Tax=Citrobacter sp. Igbk 16 TaxID=2963958 RepID=UPI00230493DA|nr:type VI secretion system contractile sheath large subunit [Citrobacter sp. Igbk 16]MDA8515708.1 type VI secretion system contractile sheath large subunit [Citrobacter sp. Igbk 16]